jgi:methylmalonyl-CoA/ethylmalonyl-CoA epimerase
MDLNLGRLAQIGYNVADLDRAERFYKEIVGLRHIARVHDRMTFFDCAGVTLMLEHSDNAEHIGRGSPIYFSCADIGLCVRELEKRGVTLAHPLHLISRQETYDLWMAFFKDPDGHMLALHCQAPRGYEPS